MAFLGMGDLGSDFLGSENEPASQENRATMSSGKATPRFGRKRSAIVFCAFFAPVSVN